MCRSTATKYVYYTSVIYLLPSAIQPVTSGTAVENSSGEVLVERVSLLDEEGGLSLEGGSLGGGGTLEEGLGMSGLVRQNEVNEIRDISSLNIYRIIRC